MQTTVIVKKQMGTDWPAVGEPMEVADSNVALLITAGYVEAAPAEDPPGDTPPAD